MEQAQGTSSSGNTMTDSPVEGKKYRGWFLTIWDKVGIIEPESCQCSVAGEEICPKTGRLHFHQFIYFKTPRTMTGVKKLSISTTHLEVARDNNRCWNYCQKECKVIHKYGTPPNNNGVKNINKLIEESNTISEVMEKDPETYCQYRNGLKDLMDVKHRKNRFFKPIEFTWIYGSTGKGKTRLAFEKGATPVEYNNGFFSDWKDSRCLCIEELRGEVPYRTLLKLSDSYHNYYEVNIKGGQKLIDIDELIITSPYHPTEVYKQQVTKDDSIDQLTRRITNIINVDESEAFV